MAYVIEFSEDAERHLADLSARDRRTVLDAVETQLSHEPTTPTKHRKLLRPNPVAAWELRVGEFRVFDNVQQKHILVIVVADRSSDSFRSRSARSYQISGGGWQAAG